MESMSTTGGGEGGGGDVTVYLVLFHGSGVRKDIVKAQIYRYCSCMKKYTWLVYGKGKNLIFTSCPMPSWRVSKAFSSAQDACGW